ncbi:hypothetical protein CEQ21_21100 [Niallia circulans]|uniref:Uncharacterized protein n=1 Tax=Niallia circulans TaxID=1397 RepID=A0A553SLQ7_NIACI|nr:hypothetical protein CEQ21_21100 [Niallia circulans]
MRARPRAFRGESLSLLLGLKRPLFPAGVEWHPLHANKILNYCIKTKKQKKNYLIYIRIYSSVFILIHILMSQPPFCTVFLQYKHFYFSWRLTRVSIVFFEKKGDFVVLKEVKRKGSGII